MPLAAFTDHLFWLVPVGVIALAIAIISTFESRRRKKLRGRHLLSHPEISDAAFLAALNLASPESAALAIKLRSAFAQLMDVPPLTLHLGDSLQYICFFDWDGADAYDLRFLVERNVGRKMESEFFTQYFKSETTLESLLRALDAAGYFAAPKMAAQ